MQSYTTQAHQRNYQGNVILPKQPILQKRRSHGIAVWILAFTVAVTSSLLGVMTLHNQQLKHRLHTLETQSTEVLAPQATTTLKTRRGKTLPSVSISEQEHETETLPAINQN